MTRKKAIDLHNRQADLFVDWYERFEKDPYFNAFTYGRIHFFDFLFEYLQKQLQKGAEILDVGCGTGYIIKKLNERGYRLTGAEPASAMLKVAQELNPGITIVDAAADMLPFQNERFDAVLAIEVFRYLNESDCLAGYKEALRVLRPGGYFIFTMANTYSLNGFALYYTLKRFVSFLTRKKIHYDHFVTPRSIEKLFQRQFGQEIESVETHGLTTALVHLMYKVHRGSAKRLAKFLEPFDIFMSRYKWHVPFAINLIVIVRKKR